MARRPTMRDVSVLASVSIKTVSRVINNDPAVAAATARRVRAAIDELAFRPDPVARSLRVGHDDAVALVVENIADPFMAEVTCAVEGAKGGRRILGLGVRAAPRPPWGAVACWAMAMVAAADSKAAMKMVLRICPPTCSFLRR